MSNDIICNLTSIDSMLWLHKTELGVGMSSCFVVDVIRDLNDISALVNTFFKDEEKTTLWLNTPNPLLGGQIPHQMIMQRRTAKLRLFIENQLGGIHP
jgi:hypothetical protein